MQQEPDKKPVNGSLENNVQDVVEQAQQEVAQTREPWYRVFQRTRVLVVIYLAIFVLFLALATFVFYNPVISVDVIITREFQENQSPWLSGLMIAVSWLGSNTIIFALLILLTAVVFWLVNLRLEAVLLAGLSIVSSVLNVVIKLIVHRPRPTAGMVEIIQTATGHSFPSGHVMSYVAFFGLLFSLGFVLFKRNRWWHYVLLIVSGLFVILVGPSRIYLGDHWASDVIGGYMFGGLLLGITLWLYLGLRRRGVLAPKVTSEKKVANQPPLRAVK
jgi:membrane-associated phospholipid phosphatase